MPNIRIKDIPTTASATSSTDFIGIDGATNGTRKLSAYSPTFGGNLTVGGTGTSAFSGAIKARSTGADEVGIGPYGTGTGGLYFGNGTVSLFNDANTQLKSLVGLSLGGNLTVSGGTISSGSGTLTLNSSANTVVLQSAGTTALTLDSSQNATFAGNINAGGANNDADVRLHLNAAGDTSAKYCALWRNASSTKVFHVKADGDLYASGPATFAGTVTFGKGGGNTTFSANGTTAESGIFTQANTGFVFFSDNATATKGIKVDVNNGGLIVLSGGLTTATAGGSAGTWKLGVYSATAPSATGFVTIDIGGTTYKLLAST